MVDAVLFALLVFSAGIAVLRGLGLAKGALALGLAPGAGLALLAVVSTWLALLGAPPPLAGVAVALIGILGVGVMWLERAAIVPALRDQRFAIGLLLVALIVPSLVMGIAFAGVEVPLSPHDGAAHTEAIQAYRLAQAHSDWYPPGLTALFAAWLELAPWLDSAKGAFELGLSLPLMASVAVFGLSVAIWSDLTIAAVGSLLLGFTYIYPYFSELWSGWPLAASLVLVVAVWAVAYQYLERPSPRLGLLSGVLLAGIIVVHGTELYTLAIVLVVVLAASWRRVRWPALLRGIGVALVVGLGCAAIYLPTLLRWAGASGAYQVGLQDASVSATGGSSSVIAGPDPFAVFALGSLGVDLPLRVVALLVGSWWAFRVQRGRSIFVVGVLFTLITSTFTGFAGSVNLVREIYALTFPWGMHYRVFMVVAICQVLLAGAGAVVGLRWLMGRLGGVRLLRRLVTLLVLTWLGLMTWAMTEFMAYPTGLVLGYTADDAAAMAWLRAHTSPGDVLVNDGYADGGIWAPYKAGVQVLLPRWGPLASDPQRLLVWRNVAKLGQVPEAMAAACGLNATYVYRGAHASEWDGRTFPATEELSQSRALRTVYTAGAATVFQIRLNCSDA